MAVKAGYKLTKVGVIPEDWECKTIDEAYEVCDNLRLPISQKVREKMNGIYPYYGPTGVQGYINEYRLEGEYALIGEDGDHFLKWCSMSMTLLVNGKFNVNNHAHVLKSGKNLITWFYHYFSNRDLTMHLTRQGAGRYKLTKSTLVNIPCAIPPVPEQQAIAVALSDVDAFIGSLDKLIAKKRDIKQAAMQQLLTGKKRLPGFGGKWEVKSIGEITSSTAGGTPSTLVATYWGGNIKWMNSGELNKEVIYDVEGRITEEGLKSSSTKIIPPLCVLIGLAGQGKTRGTVAMNMVELCTNQSIAAIFPSPSFVTKYLYYNLNSRYDELRSLSAGDGGRGGLNLTIINMLQIPLPSITEQQAIAEVLSDMDAEISALKQKRQKTRLIKQGMMQELLTGRVRLVEENRTCEPVK